LKIGSASTDSSLNTPQGSKFGPQMVEDPAPAKLDRVTFEWSRAVATPICALAATRCCSAARISGRHVAKAW
jgi:hypothetical protein